MTNNFIILVGKSGSGKTAVANELYKRYGLSQVESYTTRPARTKNEIGHTFVTDDEFDELDEFVAYTEFNGYRYGATAEQVEENQVYVVDPAGIDYFTESYYGDKHPIVIYLDVPENILFARMSARDGVEKAKERLDHDREAFKFAKDMADEIITSTNLDEITEEIYKIWRIY